MDYIDDRQQVIDDRGQQNTPPAQPAQPQFAGRKNHVLEDVSRKGWQDAANFIHENVPEKITGNPVADIAINSPKILAESAAETAGKVAPGMLSPLAVYGGAAMEAAPAVAGYAGNAMEKLSGLAYDNPGILGKAAKDATLIFAKGKQSAGPMYDAAKTAEGSPNIGMNAEDIEKGLSHVPSIKLAYQKLLSQTITPEEALAARKSIDKLIDTGSAPTDMALALRKTFDAIAKTRFGEADMAASRGAMADALRNPFATNANGTPSLAKMGIQAFFGRGAMNHPLEAVIPAAFSPLAQGVAATGAGLAYRGANYLSDALGGGLAGNMGTINAASTAYQEGKQRLSDILHGRKQ